MSKTMLLRVFSYLWGLVVLGIILASVIGKSATLGSPAEWLDWMSELFSKANIENWLLALVLSVPPIGAWLLANWLDEKAESKRR
jgi:hypothetical protein